MPRPIQHDEDALLDAARDVVLLHGSGASTIAAISKSSGAPVGSIYHRFKSVDAILAQAWMRAAKRSQASFVKALSLHADDHFPAAIAGALSVFDFCSAHPEDARLLFACRRDDILRGPLPAAMRTELTELNRPIEEALGRLAKRLFASRSRAAMERIAFALIDIPVAAVRRHVTMNRDLSDELRAHVHCAVEAVLTTKRSKK